MKKKLFKKENKMKTLITKKLTKKEEKILANLPEDSFKSFFPNHNRDFLRKEKRRLINKPKYSPVVKFLLKAKTQKEIIKKFKSLKVLKQNYEGYQLFTQRNNYNELLYVFLPIKLEKFELKPKIIKYHLGKNEEGIEQPYVLAQLPKFKKEIKIALLYDVHYGHHAHKQEKFLKYLQWIKNTPNVYAIIGGDLFENALDDGRGMTYDQDQNPMTQFDEMALLLAPIAHKIIVSTTGNHENRTYKKTGIDVMRLLADKLKIPYFNGAIWLTIIANSFKWNFFIEHGRGNSLTKGGKMNNANRPKKYTGLIHFFISGHTHDRVCESETLVTDDPINCRLVYLDQWTIVAPSFLGWENTYAYRAGYPPFAQGGVSAVLNDDGSYHGELT